MALKKTLKLIDNFGVEVELTDCYVRVASLSGTKNSMTANVDIFKAPEGEFPTVLIANENMNLSRALMDKTLSRKRTTI